MIHKENVDKGKADFNELVLKVLQATNANPLAADERLLWEH